MRWQPAGDEGVIEHVEPRRNLLYRQDEWRTKSFAANLDQLLVLVAAEPMFSESQLARALIAAESAGIAARIVLNKSDLPQAATARERLAPYRAMGIDVLEVALKREPPTTRAALLEPLLAGRTTLVLGPSGAGKSTLINLLVPDAAAQVGEISQALNSGRHTTTTHQLVLARRGARHRADRLARLPGIRPAARSTPQQLAGADARPARRTSAHCRFYNCTHLHEPGCGVRAALERGEISAVALPHLRRDLRELALSRAGDARSARPGWPATAAPAAASTAPPSARPGRPRCAGGRACGGSARRRALGVADRRGAAPPSKVFDRSGVTPGAALAAELHAHRAGGGGEDHAFVGVQPQRRHRGASS